MTEEPGRAWRNRGLIRRLTPPVPWRIHPLRSEPRTSLTLGSCNPRTSLTVASMPWKETDSMKERVKFVLEWEKRWEEGEGRLNFARLCREFGISRQVGYVWLERYREA